MTPYPHRLGHQDVLRHLEKLYRILPIQSMQLVQSGANTAVWQILAPPDRYIAKIFPSHSASAVRTEVNLIEFIEHAQAICVPDLLRNKNGNRIGSITARSFFVTARYPIIVMRVHHLRRVYPDAVTCGELISIAQHVALMHQALRRYSPRARIKRTERWGRHLGRFEDFLCSPNAAAFDRDELAKWRELDERMQQRAAAAGRIGATRDSVLHGDLGLHHVRLPSGGASPVDKPYFTSPTFRMDR